MKKKTDYPIKLILLIAGGILIRLLGALALPPWLKHTWQGRFLLYGIVAIYAVFLVPLTFSWKGEKRIAGLLIGGMVYYRGAYVFAAVTFALMRIAFIKALPAFVAVGGEILAAALYILYLSAAGKTTSHIASVEDAEKEKCETLSGVKAKAEQLHTLAEQCSSVSGECKSAYLKLFKKFAYLSPSGNSEARRLEEELLNELDILMILFTPGTAVTEEELQRYLQQLEKLYSDRKQIL